MTKAKHLISLSADESEYARNLPSLSGFVGECLRMHNEGELKIDFASLELRKKDRVTLEFTSAIEKRLAKIETILEELQSKISAL